MLPEDERSIVARALALHPWERWKSCGEFMTHLNQVAGSRHTQPNSPLPGYADSPVSQPHRGAAFA